jgi:presenilin-like A22 family membrane protease
MNGLKLSPVFISFLLIGAHFLRTELYFIVFIIIALPFLLFIKKMWIARMIQILLILSSIEWIRTIIVSIEERQAYGEQWTRLAIILGSVAVFTAGSSLVFLFRSLKIRYKLLK